MELIQIAPAAESSKPRAETAVSAWERLSAAEQEIHLRAQRYARVHVAEMRLYEPEAVQSGRTKRDLYGALRKRIDAGREEFRSRFFVGCPSMVDYFHLELVRTLANDDAELLGKEYPGAMV
jgi:glutathione S-transferase